jgi:hypothetical protein
MAQLTVINVILLWPSQVNVEPCIAIYTVRDVDTGEEFTIDYGITSAEDCAPTPCRCNCILCRQVIERPPVVLTVDRRMPPNAIRVVSLVDNRETTTSTTAIQVVAASQLMQLSGDNEGALCNLMDSTTLQATRTEELGVDRKSVV